MTTSSRPSVWIAANRLPVTWSDRHGWSRSPGGLVTALDAVVREQRLGWVGTAPPAPVHDVRRPRWEHGPLVAVDSDTARSAVDAVCNEGLWPALHGFHDLVEWRPGAWDDYRQHNRAFAEAIVEHSDPGDVVWIHDYHLFLVPAMVRRLAGDRTIAVSIHTPIDADAIASLPVVGELVEGLAAADLVGVQTERDATSLRQLFRSMDATSAPSGQVATPPVWVSPVSIDPVALTERASSAAATVAGRRLAGRDADTTLIVSIDRLDYTKGVPERLLALDTAFRRGWLDPATTQYVGVVQPTRTTVARYRRFSLDVERLAHELMVTWQRPDGSSPIDLRMESASPEQVAALLSAADVCAVTPLRDGMNLVAKEFSTLAGDVAVLVLSVGAGAYDELRDWVIEVDGGDVESVADGFRRAVELPLDVRRRWAAARRQRVAIWSASSWSRDVLRRAASGPTGETSSTPPHGVIGRPRAPA